MRLVPARTGKLCRKAPTDGTSSSLCSPSSLSHPPTLEDRAAAERGRWGATVDEGPAAGCDFNVMQEAGSEKEQRSEEEEGADGGFGPREDASKEHLSQRPAGSIIREKKWS